MNREIIRAEHIRQSFGKEKVLCDAWIHILEGETVGVAGLDNSGKTQLMKVIAGLAVYDSGNLYYRGQRVNHSDSGVLTQKVSYIGSESKILDELSTIDNLFIIRDHPWKDVIIRYHKKKEECERILKEIHINASWNIYCQFLEDNEKQRLEIIKEVLKGVRLIILDCTGHVYGNRDIQELKLLMEKMKKDGISFVFINSNMEYMMELSDTIFVLKDGRTVRNLKKKRFEKQLLYTLMAGYHIDDSLSIERVKRETGAEVLRLEAVSAGLVEKLSICVRQKEIVGILSLSSRWNHDFINVLMGEQKLLQGKIYRNEEQIDIKFLQNRSTLENKTCFICKSDMKEGLFPNLSVQQNYVFLAQQKTTGVPMGFLSKKVEKHLFFSNEQELGFPVNMLNKSVESLTNEEQFKLLIGGIKLFHPDLLVMLNPMENSDVILKKEIASEVAELADKNVGVLLISANYKEMSAVCDKILFIGNGKIKGTVYREDFESVNLKNYL